MSTLGPVQTGFNAAAERAQKQAQTLLYTMQAQEIENTLQQAAELDRLAKAAAAQGRIATIKDIPNGEPPSLAAPLIQMLELGEKSGVSSWTLAPVSAKVAEIQQKEATVLSLQQAAQEKQLQAAKSRGQLLAATAQAALTYPERYDAIMLQATRQGLPTDQFPAAFDAQALGAIRDIGIDAVKQIELTRQKEQNRAQRARWAAQNARDKAAENLAIARKEQVELQTTSLKKNDGKSPALTDAQKQLAAARQQAMEIKELRYFPPAPLNPRDYELGKGYTNNRGERAVVVGFDDNDNPVFETWIPGSPLPEVIDEEFLDAED